jgi:hypothetical protein
MVKNSAQRISSARPRAGRRSPMPPAERTFAVPCACSAVVSVTSGQAGTRVVCPTCGASVDVPRLRDLVVRETPPPTGATARPPWDAARGITFAGVAVALVAAVAAAATPPVTRLFVPQPPRPDDVRRAVAAMPITTIHAAWTEFAASGLSRTPSPLEVRFARFTRVTRGLSRTLWGVAAVGAVVAAAGAAVGASRGRARAAS